jgi:hypothetical protein
MPAITADAVLRIIEATRSTKFAPPETINAAALADDLDDWRETHEFRLMFAGEPTNAALRKGIAKLRRCAEELAAAYDGLDHRVRAKACAEIGKGAGGAHTVANAFASARALADGCAAAIARIEAGEVVDLRREIKAELGKPKPYVELASIFERHFGTPARVSLDEGGIERGPFVRFCLAAWREAGFAPGGMARRPRAAKTAVERRR